MRTARSSTPWLLRASVLTCVPCPLSLLGSSHITLHIYAKLIPASVLCITNAALPARCFLPQNPRGCLFTHTQLSARKSPAQNGLPDPSQGASSLLCCFGQNTSTTGQGFTPLYSLTLQSLEQDLTHRQKHTKYSAADVTLGCDWGREGRRQTHIWARDPSLPEPPGCSRSPSVWFSITLAFPITALKGPFYNRC